MTRPLTELEMRACAALIHADYGLRDQCITIARERSPSASFDLAQRAAMLAGLDQIKMLGVAKATRWLAVIRRDHGVESFEKVVGTLTA